MELVIALGAIPGGGLKYLKFMYSIWQSRNVAGGAVPVAGRVVL